MKRLPAVVFPDTVPDEKALIPLVTVFQPLVYCQPVENEQGAGEKNNPLCEEFFQHNLYERIYPAPLAADHERFMRLLTDLRYRGDDYAAQLTHLSLASLGSAHGREPESGSSILSNLLDRHGIRQKRPDSKELLLWQARLILKLGEFFDEDQQLIRLEMEKINAREKGLISELRKEPEYSSSFSDPFFPTAKADDGMQRLRMKAWARVFALGELSAEEYSVFVTGNKDAFDRLVDEYERIKSETPVQVMQLSLPDHLPDPTRMVEQLRGFIEDAKEILKRMNTRMGMASKDAALQEDWETLVERYFSADNHGRRKLYLYSFNKISARRLFLQSFGHDEDSRLSGTSENDESNIVIGILT